jgi:hypothetical protein
MAYAADEWEAWPELSAYVPVNADTRVFLDANYALGMESPAKSLDLAAYIDISLKPILREELQAQDWQRSRYFWTRIGYDRVFKETVNTPAEVAENRGIVSIYGKTPLPADVWLEGRVRADLRWIGGNYSTRYRFRLEATREFTVLNHTVVPHFLVEWFYDTRYDRWARTLYEVGPEITVNKYFRYELYFARQVDHVPAEQYLNAIGLILKCYF